MFYSIKEKTFCDEILHKKSKGDIDVTDEEYQYLVDERAKGFVIFVGNDGALSIREQEHAAVLAKQCTPAQGLVALFALKRITEDNILEAIAQVADPVQQYTARIGYQRATSWERGSPTMQAMAKLLQLSEEDLDALFAHVVTVQV